MDGCFLVLLQILYGIHTLREQCHEVGIVRKMGLLCEEQILDGFIFLHIHFLDIIAIEVEQGDGRTLLGWKGAQSQIEVLMFELSISGGAADECPCLINTLCAAQARLVVEERVVGNLEELRTELPLVLIARTLVFLRLSNHTIKMGSAIPQMIAIILVTVSIRTT